MKEIINAQSIISGDLPLATTQEGIEVRPVSISSMSCMELIGNKFMSLIGGAKNEEIKIDVYTLAEFVWLHSAPQKEVIALCVGGNFDDASSRKRAVLEFTSDISLDNLQTLMKSIINEAAALSQAGAKILPDDDNKPSKN